MTAPAAEREHTIRVAVDLPVDLVDAIEELHKQTHIKKRMIHEVALRRYLVEQARGK